MGIDLIPVLDTWLAGWLAQPSLLNQHASCMVVRLACSSNSMH